MRTEGFEIIHNAEKNQIIAKWFGYQTLPSIKQGWLAILAALEKYNCSAVLNDNTMVKGTWFFAFEWVDKEWLPAMIQSGLKHFAWILSHDTLAHDATMSVINEIDKDEVIIKIFKPEFDSLMKAQDWLDKRMGIVKEM
jgi:hypothetical protein